MTFTWPLALLSLLVVPLLLGIYWWLQRRRRRQAVRYSSVALLRSVLPRHKRWQRHLPIALLQGPGEQRVGDEQDERRACDEQPEVPDGEAEAERADGPITQP